MNAIVFPLPVPAEILSGRFSPVHDESRASLIARSWNLVKLNSDTLPAVTSPIASSTSSVTCKAVSIRWSKGSSILANSISSRNLFMKSSIDTSLSGRSINAGIHLVASINCRWTFLSSSELSSPSSFL